MEKKFKKFMALMCCTVLCLSFAVGCSRPARDGNFDDENDLKPSVAEHYAESMSTSVFQTNAQNAETFGLADPSKVGINKDEFLNQNLYAVPTVTEGCEFKTQDYNMTPNDNKDDSKGFAELLEAVAQKSADAVKHIVFESGNYDFVEGANGVSFESLALINDLKNVYFIGKGADSSNPLSTNILIHAEYGIIPFSINYCENIQFTEMTFDYAKSLSYRGVFKGYNAGTKVITIQIDEGYTVDSGASVATYIEHDPFTLIPRPGANVFTNQNDIIRTEYESATRTMKLYLSAGTAVKTIPQNTVVVMGKYMFGPAFFELNRCKNVIYENVDLYQSIGMAVRSFAADNLYFNRFNVISKPNSGRLLTCTADMLHLKHTKGEINITNCTFELSKDDAINVNTIYGMIYSNTAAGPYRIMPSTGMWNNFKPGVDEIYEIVNSQMNVEATVKILTSEIISADTSGYSVTFELVEGALPDNVGNGSFFMANVTRSPRVLIKNNLIRNKTNRGILLQTRDSVVENNTFANILYSSMKIFSDHNTFYEGVLPRNIEVRHNKFVNNSSNAGSDLEVMALGPNGVGNGENGVKNIKFYNNFSAYSNMCPLAIRGAREIEIDNNLFYNPVSYPNASLIESYNACISLEKAKDITITNNEMITNDVTIRSVQLVNNVDIESITFTNNKGFDREDIFGSSNVTEVSKISGAAPNWATEGTLIPIVSISQNLLEIPLDSYAKANCDPVIKMAWNDDAIFVRVEVTDNVTHVASNWWNGDNVEIFMTDATEGYDNFDVLRLNNELDCLQYFATRDEQNTYDVRTSAHIVANKAQIEKSFVMNGTNYVFEIKLPFAMFNNIKDKIDEGELISFSIGVSDNDGQKLYYLANTKSPYNNTKQIPSFMPKIDFVG